MATACSCVRSDGASDPYASCIQRPMKSDCDSPSFGVGSGITASHRFQVVRKLVPVVVVQTILTLSIVGSWFYLEHTFTGDVLHMNRAIFRAGNSHHQTNSLRMASMDFENTLPARLYPMEKALFCAGENANLYASANNSLSDCPQYLARYFSSGFILLKSARSVSDNFLDNPLTSSIAWPTS